LKPQTQPLSLPWIDPLDLAASVDEPYWVLLYSSTRTDYSGRYSYLACRLAERIEGQDFAMLEQTISQAQPDSLSPTSRWFCMLGYELKDSLERIPPGKAWKMALPPLCMMRFDTVYVFDHETQSLTCWGKPINTLNTADIPLEGYKGSMSRSLESSMSDAEYLEKAATIIQAIHDGDLYQANLTRKYYGYFDKTPDHLSIFKRLCEVSPAPYSAFIRYDTRYILSSSPELFLSANKDGYLKTRPIKGTAPRFDNMAEDNASRTTLEQSTKDKAENLMIVDLMRNDLARSCISGSVQVDSLFDVTSHATIHHMSSTISGQRSPDKSVIDSIKACFPPGSMTGAPKIHAMTLCNQLEILHRGIYSGAIGWIATDQSCELSVVIRTLVMERDYFEFQVGGGIVADSTPEGELQEIAFKSKGIIKSLQLKMPNSNTQPFDKRIADVKT
jgi:para-aminobenzoate synthetase component I